MLRKYMRASAYNEFGFMGSPRPSDCIDHPCEIMHLKNYGQYFQLLITARDAFASLVRD